MKAIAVLNKKVNPNTLSVAGTLMTYNEHDSVHLEFVKPQGFNPTILLLNVIVTEVDGPKKGTEKPFFFELTEHVDTYTTVQIMNGNKPFSIDIALLE